MRMLAAAAFFLAFGLDVWRQMGQIDSRKSKEVLHLLSAAVSPRKGGMIFYFPTWLITLFVVFVHYFQ